MQNPYAVERFIQEHNAHARAVAELQGLRRQAMAERRRAMWEVWQTRLSRMLRGRVRATTPGASLAGQNR